MNNKWLFLKNSYFSYRIRREIEDLISLLEIYDLSFLENETKVSREKRVILTH